MREIKLKRHTEGLQMKYFVLNPNKDTPYGKASKLAILIYAQNIQKENSVLANDLKDWIYRLHKEEEA